MPYNVPPPVIPPTHLTIVECARLIGWKKERVQDAIRKGKLIADTLPGGSKRLFVSRAALERFARRMGIAING